MAVAQQNEPHEPQINGGRIGQSPISSTTATFEKKIYSTSKRQRRPSVRLVELGDQPAAALTKQWKPINNRPSKTRHSTNLGGLEEERALEDRKREKGDFSFDNLAIGSWKFKGSKPKRVSNRPRMNWVSKEFDDEGGGNDGTNTVGEEGFFRDFEMEGSESPLKQKEQNPVLDSFDDDDDLRELQLRATYSVRSRSGDDGVDLDGPSDNNGGHIGRRLGKDDDDGVRVWLDGLGLGWYWPVFEIHEVDEEVLPLLTLEDLKDMGINAVGSRRKLFCAIQKLNSEGFS